MSARLSITELPDGEILIDGQPTDFCPPWKTEDAIRQQARDIDWMRAEIDNADSIARHLVRQPEGIKARAAMIAQAEEIQRLRGSLGVTEAARDGAFAENERLRTDLAAAVAERDRLLAELPLSTGRDVNETRERLGPITRIADGPSERAYVCATTAREVVGYVIADRDSAKLRAEQAEARLAAIDNAPTVAVVCSSHSFGQFVQQRFFGSQLPRIGTELIARPAKD